MAIFPVIMASDIFVSPQWRNADHLFSMHANLNDGSWGDLMSDSRQWPNALKWSKYNCEPHPGDESQCFSAVLAGSTVQSLGGGTLTATGLRATWRSG